MIAYRSTSISIEVANTKIALTKAAADVEKAASALKVNAKAVEESQRELLSSRIGNRLVDDTLKVDCSGLSRDAKLGCERLNAIEKIQDEIDKTVQAATKAAALLF